jgi:hypothetical protein
VNAVGGAWMFITPWVYGFASGQVTGGATNSTASASITASSWLPWNAWIIGGLILIVALWALAAPESPAAEWCNAVLGAWLFVSPWVLRFNTFPEAAWSAWIVGGVVLILSLWTLSLQPRSITVRRAESR